MSEKSHNKGHLPKLPKAPKLAIGPKVSELKAKLEAEQHALRRLRMILYDKRFNSFHYPVPVEDAPNYGSIIKNPIDMATLLYHVDNGHYITCAAFMQDIDLIVSNAKAYNVDDYNGARIFSRAYELRDAVVDGKLPQTCYLMALDSCYKQLSHKMSDKGKRNAPSSRKRKRTLEPTLASLQAYAQNSLGDIEKANQLLPAQDMVKFLTGVPLPDHQD
ncbi:ATPase family AAA domain-containing protein At1g05910-like [Arachis stenosperma]|uniref:ATPase family AAA domain-containing protein At1g05910-like n=1 Tax=Arachis stenosperma TaxID=217475 RepID=UPI0025AD718D|nr:ATPase family AAA domain-containing protein At1g05910-like [Arachis stenosperma]